MRADSDRRTVPILATREDDGSKHLGESFSRFGAAEAGLSATRHRKFLASRGQCCFSMNFGVIHFTRCTINHMKSFEKIRNMTILQQPMLHCTLDLRHIRTHC
jgi:hypothetical protein